MLCQIFTRLRSRILSEKGTAAMMVISTIAILSILAAGMSTIIVNEMQMIVQYQNRTRAYYLAQAGIAHALWSINNGGGGDIGSETAPQSLGSGGYWTDYNVNSKVLRAWGRIGSGANTIERRISVRVNYTSGEFTEEFNNIDYADYDWELGKTRTRRVNWLFSGELKLAQLEWRQFTPAIAYNSSSNEFLAVWKDERNGAAAADIYAQRIKADGTLAGTNFGVATKSGWEDWPDVAFSSAANQFMVVWYDGSVPAISAQRVKADGSLEGGPITVAASNNGVNTPAITYNSSLNQFLVVWEDRRNGAADIYAQRVKADGTLEGTDFAISTAISSQTFPDVAYNPFVGQFLIIWQDYRGGDFDPDIYAQIVNADGNLAGGEIAVSTVSGGNAGGQVRPAAVSNPYSNQFLIAWQDGRFGQLDIYAQRVQADGTLVGSEIPVAWVIGNSALPATVYNPSSNQFLLVWQDTREDSQGAHYTIYAQRIKADGNLEGTNFKVSTGGAQYLFYQRTAIAYNSTSDQFLLVWQDGRNWSHGSDTNSSNFSQIYGRRLDSLGNPLDLPPNPDIKISEHKYFSEGKAQSTKAADTTPYNIISAILRVTYVDALPQAKNTSVSYLLTNNGSFGGVTATFEGVSGLTETYEVSGFGVSGSDLRWRALLYSNSGQTETPRIDRLVITYITPPVSLDYATWRSN